LPSPEWEFRYSLQQNEMFLLGANEEEVAQAINEKKLSTLAPFVYRVQKLSVKSTGSIDVWFRHHAETKLIDDGSAKEAKRFYNIRSLGAFYALSPSKIRINLLGDIIQE